MLPVVMQQPPNARASSGDAPPRSARLRLQKATVNVRWRRDSALDMWVPAKMNELYEGPWRFQAPSGRIERYDIDGTATYSNYRRFTVDVRIK